MTILIEVLTGRDRSSATSLGSLQFALAPRPGEHLVVEDKVFQVKSCWHQPGVYAASAKFAVLCEEGNMRPEDLGSAH